MAQKYAIRFTIFLIFLLLPGIKHLNASETEEGDSKFPYPEKITVKTDSDRNNVFLVTDEDWEDLIVIEINGEQDTFLLINRMAPLDLEIDRAGALYFFKYPGEYASLQIYHLSLDRQGEIRIRKIPLWLSLFPPLFAIGLALVFREVIISLVSGILAGAFIASGMYFDSLITAFLRTADTYILGALNDPYHLSIILLSLLIGSMVAIISNNGGMQ